MFSSAHVFLGILLDSLNHTVSVNFALVYHFRAIQLETTRRQVLNTGEAVFPTAITPQLHMEVQQVNQEVVLMVLMEPQVREGSTGVPPAGHMEVMGGNLTGDNLMEDNLMEDLMDTTLLQVTTGRDRSCVRFCGSFACGSLNRHILNARRLQMGSHSPLFPSLLSPLLSPPLSGGMMDRK